MNQAGGRSVLGSSGSVLRSSKLIAGIVLASLLLSIAWTAYTRYTDDDAYITFRYARQLAEGHGFVYNLGERVYGTTTPLLTLLLDGWIRVTHLDVALGAHVIDIGAFALGLIVLWLGLRKLDATRAQQVAVLLLIGFSPRLWYLNFQGMETPLVLLLMASTWYAMTSDRPGLAGILAGLLLWTRIDTAVWLVAMFLSALWTRRRQLARFVVSGALVYLPWVVFAWVYFGSPIPNTAIAKWVAYGVNSPPYLVHLGRIARFLSPVELPASLDRIGLVLAAVTIALALWGALYGARHKALLDFRIFVFLDVVVLTLTRTTYFDRYFMPLLWATLVLAGLTLGGLWDRFVGNRAALRAAMMVLVAGMGVVLLVVTVQHIGEVRDKQIFRNESSLKAIGLWLEANTPPSATVLLEPLGYVGFYSDRTMIDEVGLVTPRVVELKRRDIAGPQYALEFQPDYVLFHCDDTTYLDALPRGTGAGGSLAYRRLMMFDPLGYQTTALSVPDVETARARSACYELFGKETQ